MLFKLLGLPISAPVAGIRFCLDQLVEMAEQELTDDTPVREELLLLTLRLEEGEITDDAYAVEEARLMRQLREIRAYKEQRLREQAGLEPAADPDQPAVISLSGGQLSVELHADMATAETTDWRSERPASSPP